MIISEEEYLAHYGTPRKSGRYPWGSGKDGPQHNKSLLDYVDIMRKQGLTDSVIADGLDLSRVQLQAQVKIAKNEQKQADINQAVRLKATGMSNVEIGKEMGNRNESSVRSLLAPGQMEKTQALMGTVNMLKEHVDTKGPVDVGSGVEHHLNLSRDSLNKAIAVLEEKGYVNTTVQVEQLGTGGNKKTSIKVLAPPGTVYRDIVMDIGSIKPIMKITEDDGLSWSGILPPLTVSPDRVKVRYKEEGGDDADGVIYVRRGVTDLSLGASHYAQVRVSVNGTHYLKGMAMYKDDLPKGVDLVFNTTKSSTGNKLDAMKPLKTITSTQKIDPKTGKRDPKTGVVDQENPFGAVVRQLKDPTNDKKLTSAMNVVNEQGDWDKWSRNLSSQMLSKQSPELAKVQLDMAYDKKKLALDEISSLTNPVVRAKLLQSFADSADSSAVQLKAAALPRQSSHVILPINSMKETEIYAPNFNNGERVALIRYPHGGIFEIPELTVNNRHAEAKKLIGTAKDAPDAVGINSKVAERLSGADFDGDTVLVIPNGSRSIKTKPPLAGLVGFNPQREYPAYEGMVPMTVHSKGTQMGIISNLITDMTIKKASQAELARAVRHSMVVIDAEKHKLNYKLSAKVNGISALKAKYQTGPQGGASTLISARKGVVHPLEFKPQSEKLGGPIDKKTGALVYTPTGDFYITRSVNKKTGVVTEKKVFKTTAVKRLAYAKDAHDLVSKDGGTKIEKVYADHSNKLKALANTARLEMVHIKPPLTQKAAKKAYAKEVDTLNHKLILAQMNSPLERQAQVIANVHVQALRDANKDMEKSEIKKMKYLALDTARKRTGADKEQIVITDNEWAAIQAGAVSPSKLKEILNNTNLKLIQELATPRAPLLMNASKKARANAMAALGYTQAEIAAHLGVSLTTLKTNL